ncbi:MAG: DNA/RNA nuclease SfsA [candidate division Zixibacteria bacterium]|nr:DNA/RNA nuclease SfsA [candidate division Zixibacteria bacterium]
MLFDFPLIEARFLERINRFTCRVEVNGCVTLAHLHDPGRLDTVLAPDLRLYLRPVSDIKRRTRYDIILGKIDTGFALINSSFANKVFREVLETKSIESFADCTSIKTEFEFRDSRIDFLIGTDDRKQTLVEVKSVTKAIGSKAFFPDAPTKRGVKHLLTLREALMHGYNTAIVFIIFRNGIESFSPDRKIDPVFADTLYEAYYEGVKVIALNTSVGLDSVEVNKELPVEFDLNS